MSITIPRSHYLVEFDSVIERLRTESVPPAEIERIRRVAAEAISLTNFSLEYQAGLQLL